MKLLVPIAIGALALGGCSQGDSNNVAAENGLSVEEPMMTNDPATTDLNLDANASAVDQAINQTDQQSGAQDAADSALDSASNMAE